MFSKLSQSSLNRRPSHLATWVECDGAALTANIQQLRNFLPSHVEICLPVKANAYGHGLEQVVEVALAAGIGMFGVATLNEGIQLAEFAQRHAPSKILRIFVMAPLLPEQIVEANQWPFEYTVTSKDFCRELGKSLPKVGRTKVHLEIDTGMNRTGVTPEEFPKLWAAANDQPGIEVVGIYTHFATADDSDRTRTDIQLRRFRDALADVPDSQGIAKHAANSAATMFFPSSHFDMVRPGLALYGLYPRAGVPKELNFQPVMAIKSRVTAKKRVTKNTEISYGGRGIAPADGWLATIAIGYGDGYIRAYSDRAPVLIGGHRHKVAGIVNMDQTIVFTGDFEPSIGEEAVVLGKQGREEIIASELAELARTNEYEVATNISGRPKRVIG